MKNKKIEDMSFSELKIAVEEARKKPKVVNKKEGVWNIGNNYLIRTVTMIQVGRLIAVTEKELVLEDVAWVADTGRFNEFLKGKINSNAEIEPFPDGEVIIGRGAIIDATEWKNPLLREVK